MGDGALARPLPCVARCYKGGIATQTESTRQAGVETCDVLVVGGGIAGITASLEAAESGARVLLVEKTPYLGGRVLQLARYFPKLCPPGCGMEINLRRLRDNPSIALRTLTEVEEIEGEAGRFTVRLRENPRLVTDRCTACGECALACPVVRPNPLQSNQSETKAIYLQGELVHPLRYVIDRDYCLGESCARCAKVCPHAAIELTMAERTILVEASTVIWATGWQPYTAARITNLAYGRHPNIVTNLELERMAAPDGPTGGYILRPSDGRPPRRVAFIQCAGSRDRLHLGYCSGVCCLASLKEASYILDRDPEAEVHVFYIDLRTPGPYETFAHKMLARPGLHAVKGKVADITGDPESGNLTVFADDMTRSSTSGTEVDLVVLATGMVPNLRDAAPTPVEPDSYGFLGEGSMPPGMFAAGCARAPVDVQTATLDATAAAMGALGVLAKSRSTAR